MFSKIIRYSMLFSTWVNYINLVDISICMVLGSPLFSLYIRYFNIRAHEIYEDVLLFVTYNPVESGLLAILFVLLVLAIYKVIKYINRSRSTKLISAFNNSHSISILMHKNPDPDAMGSALGLKELLENETNCDDIVIQYPGKIRHHENRAFQAVLDVSFDNIETVAEIESEHVILVDQNDARGFEKDIHPDAIIDHHPDSNPKQDEYLFYHVDEEIGACATLIIEYFNEQGYDFSGAEDKSRISENIATGLRYGIITDTNNITKGATERDTNAAILLHKLINNDKLYRISNPEIDEDSIDIKSKAIDNRIVQGPFLISDVGTVSNPDSIPMASEELTRLEGISSVVVLGEYDNEIRLSGRSYDDRVHMGEVLHKVSEEIPNASAGGHSDMGGGQIPITVIDHSDISKTKIYDLIFKSLDGKI